MSYRTVVVGTDGSDSSMAAVDRAAEVAAAANATLVVVCAYTPMSPRQQAMVEPQLGNTGFDRVPEPAAKEAVAKAVERAQELGVARVAELLFAGDAGQALLSVAEQESADLIVVGNRGINTLSGRVLGSVPSDMSHRAPCDVLIVHTTSGGRS